MSSVSASLIYRLDEIELDVRAGCLRRGGQEVHVKPKAFQILVYLVSQRDRLVSKEELMERFWKDTAVSEDVLAHSIAELRRALGDSSRDSQYLRTVPKRGYRFVGEVREIPLEALITTEQITTVEVREEYEGDEDREQKSSCLDTELRALPAAAPRLRGRLAIWFAVAALCVAALPAVWRYWSSRFETGSEAGIRAAIVPFENRSARADMDWLRIGLADMLATKLSESPRIALITPEQLQRGLRQLPMAAIRHRDALRAAREAGARAMITGAFASLGETVRLDTQIYDVRSDRLLGGESLTVDKPAVLLSQLDLLGSKLAARLGAPGSVQAHLSEVMTSDLEAYRLYSLGLARARDLRAVEAIASYQKATELDPGFAMAYARIGFTYSSTWARPAEGKPYLEKAFRLSDRLTPRDRLFIRAWYAVACLDYEGAERAYREILSAFPMELEAYYALGTLLEGERRYEQARQILERGLAVESDMPQLHNILSSVYFGLGENAKALESAQRYVSLSGEPNAYDTLAAAYQRLGRYDEAKANYLEAIRRKPDFEIAIIHLGNLYFQLGRYRDALAQYREYTRIAPSKAERVRGHVSAAWVYWRKGDVSDMQRELAEAANDNGQEVAETLLLDAGRGRIGLTEDVRRQLAARGIARGSRASRRFAYFLAGQLELREHKTEEALEHFRAALREPAIYWYIDPLETCLADAFLALGRWDEAIAEYRRVLTTNPNYPMARYQLGQALDRKGTNWEARVEFQRFLAIWKDADADVPELIDARKRLNLANGPLK